MVQSISALDPGLPAPILPPLRDGCFLASCKGKPLPRHPLGQGQINEPVSAYFPLLSFSLRLFVPFSWGLWSISLPPTGPPACPCISVPPAHPLSNPNPPATLPLSSSLPPLSSLSPHPPESLYPRGLFLPTPPPTTCLLSASLISSNCFLEPRLAPSEPSLQWGIGGDRGMLPDAQGPFRG